jgi:lipopolysaccharide transport system permease protein
VERELPPPVAEGGRTSARALVELRPELISSQAQDAGDERDPASVQPVLDLGAEPASWRDWLSTLWGHRGVIWVLARKDFQVRFKRATFGVMWAVAAPLLQATVLIFVFSHIVHIGSRVPYGAYVLSGILGWSYFTSNLPTAVTSIIDGSGLTDKVWFPRAILPLVPCLSGLVGLGIAMILLLIGAPLLGGTVGPNLLLLIPACALFVSLTIAIALVTSALQVYFRDVRWLVSALLMVWLYATPIMYPQSAVGKLGPLLDLNPMTGVVTLFHLAVLGQTGSNGSWHRPVAISIFSAIALTLIGIEAHRRRDRVFVDLL